MRLIFSFLLFAASLGAQTNLLMRQAEKAMEDLDYTTAIVLYEQSMRRKKQPEAIFRLAECYRKVSDPVNAERWLARAVKLPEAKPVHWLQYGLALQTNGKCADAKPWFERYLAATPDDTRAKAALNACNDPEGARNAGLYLIYKTPVNSEADDYAPAMHQGELIFSSTRAQNPLGTRTDMWTGEAFATLFAVPVSPQGATPGDFTYSAARKFSKDLSTKYHEASLAFAPDGQMVYFTRNSAGNERSEEGLLKLKIYQGSASSQADPGSWTNLAELPFNNNAYNTAHPALSADGQRLFFSSDRPGGFGGMDLYISTWEGTRWSAPMNLGAAINTSAHEVFPFLATDERLWFASAGHGGLGGLDICYAMPQGGADWSRPVLPGAPLNSRYDDFALTHGPDPSWGYFCSNRPGGKGGDDIFAFKKIAITAEIVARDAERGNVLPGAAMQYDLTGVGQTSGTSGQGFFDLYPDTCGTLTLNFPGYQAVRRKICTYNISSDSTLRVEVAMSKVSEYALQGIIFDMNYGLPAEGARVLLRGACVKNRKDTIIITQADGRYRFALEQGCCYSVKAVKDNYLAAVAGPLCAQSGGVSLRANLSLLPQRLGPGETVGPRFNEVSGLYEDAAGRPANAELGSGISLRNGVLYDNGLPHLPAAQRFAPSATGEGFVLNIYYDLDKVIVQNDSQQALENLLELLQNNPALQLEIASHTDSQGNDNYNLRLSQRRAEAVVEWLTRRGIDRARLRPAGYGETRPVVTCPDPATCSEAQHRQNRRTEFSVIR